MINVKTVHDNLSVGQIYKNYKVLCKGLGEDIKDGTSKKAQLDNWKRYFDFDNLEKGKQPIIIKEIYDIPRPIIDGRTKGANSKYLNHIEVLILNLLTKQFYEYTYVGYRKLLLKELGMVNHKYIDDEYDKIVVDKNLAYQKQINDWKNLYFQLSDKILFRSLESMQRRALINYRKELTYTIDNVNYIGTDEDEKRYKKVTKDVLKDMSKKYNKKFDSLIKIYPKYINEYFVRIGKIVLKEFGWIEVKSRLKITLNEVKFVKVLSAEELLLHKIILNEKVISAMHDKILLNYNNILKLHEEDTVKSNKRMVIGKISESFGKYYHLAKQSDYVETLDRLTEEFVKIDK